MNLLSVELAELFGTTIAIHLLSLEFRSNLLLLPWFIPYSLGTGLIKKIPLSDTGPPDHHRRPVQYLHNYLRYTSDECLRTFHLKAHCLYAFRRALDQPQPEWQSDIEY
jgi:hypothetical protein